jgi:ABC-type branched-subunit amino acid transport system substrate-binding protein
MVRSLTRTRLLNVAAVVLLLVATSCGDDGSSNTDSGSSDTTTNESPGTTSASEDEEPQGPVRGFDGTTIKVASIGIKAQLPGVEWGAKARIQRFNEENEIDGIQIDYTEYVDDKFDPANTLSEFRRLVTDSKIFAIVGDVSPINPGDYIKQQGVPVFGSGFDNTYCAAEPDPEIWSFGYNGCVVPTDPTEVPDNLVRLYDYAVEELGTDSPTVALFNTDTDSGRVSSNNALVTLEGDGFDTLPALAILPTTPVADYTPYVQQVLTSDDGKAPQVVICYAAADCVPMYTLMKESGFEGIFYHTIYSDLLVAPMKDTLVGVGWANFGDPSPAMTQLREDVKAVKADQGLDLGVAAGYFTTDMFITALKIAYEADGKAGITPEKVRAAAAGMTWEIEGLVGPTKYPESTVKPTPSCGTLAKSDGTKWITVREFSCSDRSFPVN